MHLGVDCCEAATGTAVAAPGMWLLKRKDDHLVAGVSVAAVPPVLLAKAALSFAGHHTQDRQK